MHLYSTDRPEASPGRKALLLDGSAVPQVMIYPLDDHNRVMLSIMLREYEQGSGYSYKYYFLDMAGDDLEAFFLEYKADPEHTLELYFSWIPRVIIKPKLEEISSEALNAQRYVNDLL